MKRRSFLSTTAGTTALISGITGCTENRQASDYGGKSDALCVNKDGKLGGKTLEALRMQYESDLFEDFVPFHDTFVIDHEYGSFMANTDHDGSHPNTNTSSSFMGRGIWLYSFLYNNLAQEDKYLDTAAKAVKFILRHQPAGDNYWPGTYSREGEVIGTGKGSLPGDCYIAEGLAEYAKATGETKLLDLAKETLFKCLKKYDNPNFKDGTCPYPGARNLWYWMLFMWFGINSLKYKADSELEKLVKRCIDAIMNHHQNPKFELMNNVINHDLSRSKDPKHSELAGCGHATEATWMIMYEAVRTKDKQLFDLTARRFRRHAVVSKDDVYGGYFNDLRNVDENQWQLNKNLMGTNIYSHQFTFYHRAYGAEWAKEIFSDQFAWVQEKLPLKQYGYSLWMEPGDRLATFVPHGRRKDNYHHPRHLMLNLLSLRRMVEGGGKVSGVFG